MRFVVAVLVFLTFPDIARAVEAKCDDRSMLRDSPDCADQILRPLKQEMDQAFAALMGRLSKAGQAEMSIRQSEWQKDFDRDSKKDSVAGLANSYRARSTLLRHLNHADTPMIVRRQDRTNLPSKGWIHAEWPLLDGGQPWIKTANEQIDIFVGDLIPEDTGQSIRTEFSVGLMGPDFVSLALEVDAYPTESYPYADYNRHFLNLTPTGKKAVELAELFVPGSAWGASLENACRDVLEDADMTVVLGGWTATEQGISIECREKIHRNDLAPMADVPWSVLRPMLTSRTLGWLKP